MSDSGKSAKTFHTEPTQLLEGSPLARWKGRPASSPSPPFDDDSDDATQLLEAPRAGDFRIVLAREDEVTSRWASIYAGEKIMVQVQWIEDLAMTQSFHGSQTVDKTVKIRLRWCTENSARDEKGERVWQPLQDAVVGSRDDEATTEKRNAGSSRQVASSPHRPQRSFVPDVLEECPSQSAQLSGSKHDGSSQHTRGSDIEKSQARVLKLRVGPKISIPDSDKTLGSAGQEPASDLLSDSDSEGFQNGHDIKKVVLSTPDTPAGQTVGAFLKIMRALPSIPHPQISRSRRSEVGDICKVVGHKTRKGEQTGYNRREIPRRVDIVAYNLRTRSAHLVAWETFLPIGTREWCSCHQSCCRCVYESFEKSMAWKERVEAMVTDSYDFNH